jgi:type I restriction enzyme S subunit
MTGAILRPKKPHDTAFVFDVVKNPAFTNAMARFAEARSLYPAVDEPEIRRYEIMTPPHGLRAQFSENYEFLADLDANTRQGNDSSGLVFDNLLSRAFTGELTAEWEAENADWIVERQTFYEHLPRLALLALLLERHERAGRNSETLITALMKYVFLTQMEGRLRHRFYRFVPYHYGPCAMELYDDLNALESDGLITVKNDTDEDKTRIRLTAPVRAAALLEEEAHKDDPRLAAMDQSGEEADAEIDPVMLRLLRRRAEILETLRSDATAILDAYGDLDHKHLLETVYEKYPAYAKKSRLRKTTANKSDKETTCRKKRKK